MIQRGVKTSSGELKTLIALRRIIAQRHNHRLPEWHTFIDWIRTLPFAEELILVGLETEE